MKAFKSKGTLANLFTFFFFLAIASLIAIKVNYFTDLKYQTSSKVSLNGNSFESRSSTWPFSFTGEKQHVNPELLKALTDAVSEHGWNIEFFQPHRAGNTMIATQVPLHVQYSLKTSRFIRQDFEIEMKDRSHFTVAYEYGGIKRIRSVKAGQQLNEIELNLILTVNEQINPVIINDYVNKPVIASIYSPQAFAEKLIKYHLSVECNHGASSLITVNYPVPEKAKHIADEVARQLAKMEYNRKNKLIDEQLAKITKAEIPAQVNTPASSGMIEKAEEAALATLLSKQYELSLQLKALDNLHDYLRQNRIEGNAVPAFGTLNDPVFAEYITSLNTKIHQLNNTTVTEEQTRLKNEIEFLKNTLAEGMRNTRKTVALQMDETRKHIQKMENTPSIVSPLIQPELSGIEQQLALKKINLLLDKKAEASEMAEVINSPLPLTPENPDHATVWVICIVAAILCSLITRKVLKKKTPVKVQVQYDERPDELFTSVSASGSDTAQQVKKWAQEIITLNHGQPKPTLVTLTHASNNSSSLTAFELAAAAMASGSKVLVIDANLSKEQLSTITGTEILDSLADMLVSSKPLSDCLIALPSGLKTVSVGMQTHEFHPVFMINKMQDLIAELPEFDLIFIAAPSSQESLTLQLIRFSHSAFVIHTTGQASRKITQRWKSVFRMEHVYDVESDNTVAIPTRLMSKSKIRSIRSRIHNEPKQMNWLKRAALWFY